MLSGWMGRVALAGAALLVVALVWVGLRAFGPGPPGPGRAPAVAGRLTDLTSVGQLQARFNADAGVPRLVLILSPT